METLDFFVKPEDGWVLVATNPAYLRVKPAFYNPWQLAATTSGAPQSVPVAATGSIDFTGQPNDGGTVMVGDITYTFVDNFNDPGPFEVLIGVNQAASETALSNAINGRTEIPATNSTGEVDITGVPLATGTVGIGTETYTFVALRAAPFQVTIGADASTTGDNFVTAITADSTLVTAVNATGTVTLTSIDADYAANFALTTDATNVSVSGASMTGGNDAGPAIAANDATTAAVNANSIDLTATVPGASGNSTALVGNTTNVAVTAFSGGVDPLVGMTFGTDEFKKFEAYEFNNEAGSIAASEFYVLVNMAPNGFPQGRVRFSVIREQ